MRQKIFNDIYDRLNQFEQGHMHADSFPTFQQSTQEHKCVERRHRLKNIKLPYKNNEKFLIPNDYHFSSSLLDNQVIRDKFSGRFLQLHPSKPDRKGQNTMRHNSSDKNSNRKIIFDTHFPKVPEYLTISENTKKALQFLSKKQNIEDFHNLIKKRQSIWPQLIVFKKPQTESALQVKKPSVRELKKIDSTPKAEVEKPEIRKNQSEKKQHPRFEPIRKPKLDLSKKNYQELAEEQRKNKLQIKKQISQDYAKPFKPPQNITAYAYIVYEPEVSQKYKNHQIQSPKRKFLHSYKIICSQNSKSMVEIASLTKIMTCITAIDICSEYKLNPMQEKINIGKFQSNIGGTSAQIQEGQIYTLEDLYHGLMLPSGNDASIAIAVWGGRILLDNREENRKKLCYQKFIDAMNKKAKSLGMLKTNYANSHGLVNFMNKSCAYDLAILCEYAMKNQKFQEIVSCKEYENTILYQKPIEIVEEKKNKGKKEEQFDGDEEKQLNSEEDIEEKKEEEIRQRTVRWQNTHQLLHQRPEEYVGIKTGVTTTAGPCLASCIRKDDRMFIIIVLGCQKLVQRFRDTQKLKKWTYNYQGIKIPKKKKKKFEESDEILEIDF